MTDFRVWRPPVPETELLKQAVGVSVVGVKMGSEIFCLDCRRNDVEKFLINYAALADGTRCLACARVYNNGEWT
jgi:hypothetical protein